MSDPDIAMIQAAAEALNTTDARINAFLDNVDADVLAAITEAQTQLGIRQAGYDDLAADLQGIADATHAKVVVNVNADTGDDELGDGTNQNPFETVAGALDNTRDYGAVSIILRSTYHAIDRDWIIGDRTVYISSYAGGSTTIEQVLNNAGDEHAGRIVCGRGELGFIRGAGQSNMVIKTAFVAGVSPTQLRSLVIFRTGFRGVHLLNGCRVELGNYAFITASTREDTPCYVSAVEIDIVWRGDLPSDPLLGAQFVACFGSPIIFLNRHGTGVPSTRPDGATANAWEDMLGGIARDANGTPRNYVTDFVL